jgi:hypothetical protein
MQTNETNQNHQNKKLYTNRLINEKSPYLLQHAHNPVDWYPWGEAAFQKAKTEDKPIFLSIGYSTCHWCHVMAEESFEDQRTADILNTRFVPVKVDREERPDIDSVYMRIVIALTGRGGWPLSLFLTPEGKPIFGGTYFPPRSLREMPAFADVLLIISKTWEDKKQDLIVSSEQIVELLKKDAEKPPAINLFMNAGIFKHAFKELQELYDPEFGGFNDAPKFPTPHQLFFLLRYHLASQEQIGPTADSDGVPAPGDDKLSSLSPLHMAEKTLDHMLRGGIYDHLGGGFHRYSTDREWRVPHFEKMLYDQVLVSRALLEVYQLTKHENYARVAEECLNFLLNELSGEEGAFYCALDADSGDPISPEHKKEGVYYLWSLDEILSLLDEDEGPVFVYCFGITAKGNSGSEDNQNVLYLAHTSEEAAVHFKLGVEDINKMLRKAKEKLNGKRAKRPAPHRDDKILTDWNGLALGTFAFAFRVLKTSPYRDRYRAAAEKVTRFLLTTMTDARGRLLHRYRAGEAGVSGLLDDYAFLTYGLLELYETTFKPDYLEKAHTLMAQTLELFWDDKDNGFFLKAKDEEELLLKVKDIYDGALPSGNSLALYNLLRLARLTLNKDWLNKGEAMFKTFAAAIHAAPSAYTEFLCALYFLIGKVREVVVAQGKDTEKVESVLESIYNHFLPFKVQVLLPYKGTAPAEWARIINLVPAIGVQIPVKEQTSVYICENYTCQVPITDLTNQQAELDQRLR